MNKLAFLASETVMDEDSGIFPEYVYWADGVATRSKMYGTVAEFKQLYGVKEVRKLDIFAPERRGLAIGDKVPVHE